MGNKSLNKKYNKEKNNEINEEEKVIIKNLDEKRKQELIDFLLSNVEIIDNLQKSNDK